MAKDSHETTSFRSPTRWSIGFPTFVIIEFAIVGVRPEGGPLWLLAAWWVVVAILVLLTIRTWKSRVVFTDQELIFFNTFSTKRVPLLNVDEIVWSHFDSFYYYQNDWTNVVAVRQGKVVAKGPWFSWRYWTKVNELPKECARLEALNAELQRRKENAPQG